MLKAQYGIKTQFSATSHRDTLSTFLKSYDKPGPGSYFFE